MPDLDKAEAVKPDVVVLLPEGDGNVTTTIAFEFERSSKAKDRLFNKLKIYASNSRLDGVMLLQRGKLFPT
ncbi:MAG: hypothetical protein IPM57_07090 [Oligoflexia bacterium]|nr:hypothetical protein [Oligoflexia bacterium]